MHVSDGTIHSISLAEILFFATGVKCIPPVGFSPSPSLTFLHDREVDGTLSAFPKANTCSCCLELPVAHRSYAAFTDAVVFGIKNAHGFGYA